MENDRFVYGYDAGNIIDGVVSLDKETGEIILVDDDGDVFIPSEALKSLIGKKVRLTMISFEAMASMESMLKTAESPNG
jgi:hypothetical protein